MALSGLNLPNAGDFEAGFLGRGDYTLKTFPGGAAFAFVLQITVDAFNQSVD